MHPCLLLLVIAVAAAGCTKRATEIRVRDPGLVAVSVGAPQGGWAPALPPDRRPATVPISGGASVTRRDARLRVTWTDTERGRDLIDDQGRFPRTKTRAGITAQAGIFHVPYVVSPRGVFSYDERTRRPDANQVLLSTPTHNLDYARYVEGPHKWPAYVMLPIGAVLSAAGVAVIASADGQYSGLQRLGGSVLLISGAPLLGIGIYVAASEQTVRPLVPGVSTGEEE